jgi:broad specificity phosphatase PhoE
MRLKRDSVPIMNDNLLGLLPLKNSYFALRHGQSLANLQSIIVSDPEVGTTSYGLTEIGRRQVEARLNNLPPAFDARLRIISSDFLRARETAAIISSSLAVIVPVHYSEKLRERFFGELDGGPDNRYADVWKRDCIDAQHDNFGVETAVSVVKRTVSLVRELEAQYRDSVILLVAHGDVLQLLQTAFEAISPARHRLLPPLQVAEIRQLIPVPPSRQGVLM